MPRRRVPKKWSNGRSLKKGIKSRAQSRADQFLESQRQSQEQNSQNEGLNQMDQPTSDHEDVAEDFIDAFDAPDNETGKLCGVVVESENEEEEAPPSTTRVSVEELIEQENLTFEEEELETREENDGTEVDSRSIGEYPPSSGGDGHDLAEDMHAEAEEHSEAEISAEEKTSDEDIGLDHPPLNRKFTPAEEVAYHLIDIME